MFVRRKERERKRARELRQQGWSLPRIADEVGVAKSSVSLWVRDLPRPRFDRGRPSRKKLPMLGGDVKRCGKCKRNRPVEFFSRHPQRGRQHWCRDCFAVYFEERGSTHRAQVRASALKRVAVAREYVLEYLDQHPCVDCGETHLVVLDFDHVRGSKTAGLSSLVAAGSSLRPIAEEIAKCEVVCANCHRRRTYKRGNSWRVAVPKAGLTHLSVSVLANLEMVRQHLEGHGCRDCGLSDLPVLEFDHVGVKRFNVMTGVWLGYGRARILDEIAQCEVRCANCHRLRTAERALNYRYLAVLRDTLKAQTQASMRCPRKDSNLRRDPGLKVRRSDH